MERPPKLGKRRTPYNYVMDNVRPELRRIRHTVKNVARSFVVRLVQAPHSNGTQFLQTASGGAGHGMKSDYTHLASAVIALEQQGFASQVSVGARGLQITSASCVGAAQIVCARKQSQRPKFLKEWEICAYQEVGSRMYLAKTGEVRIEAGLADYKEDGADHDEGSKLRLHHGETLGAAELYGEAYVQLRSQAAGGTGDLGTVKIEANGTVRVQASSEDVSTFSRTTFNPDGSVTMEASAGGGSSGSITIGADGTMTFNASGNVVVVAGGEVQLGGDTDLEEVVTKTKLNAVIGDLRTALNTHVHANHGLTGTVVPGVFPFVQDPNVGSPSVKATI